MYSEAENIYKNSSKINRSEYAGICNNLGQLYTAEKEYDKANTYFDNAKNIYENLYGKNNKDYLTVINNLAGLDAEKGEFKQAEDLYTEIKQITGNFQGTQHTDYADVCNNLAALYYWKGNYKKAEPLYLEAQKIYLMLYGKRHYNYAVNCLNLALLYDASGKYNKAETYYLQADKIINYLASKSAEFMSENEREHYINAFVSNNADIYLSFFSDYAQTDKKLTPLYLAVQYHYADLAKFFIERGADPLIKTITYDKAYEISEKGFWLITFFVLSVIILIIREKKR